MATLPPNIYEQQQRNRRQTVWLMIAFCLFFSFLGYGFDVFYFGNDALGILFDEGRGFPVATLIALSIAGIGAVWGLNGGAVAVLKSAQAMPAPENDPKYQMLHNVVEEMSIAAGMPKPKVYIVPDTDPNAFATGKDPQNSYIAVTQGLLDNLNREELQGVIAHEMSHIRNYDIRLMTVVAALVGAIVLLSDWGTRIMRFGGGKALGKRSSSRSKNGGPLLLIVMVIWIIAVILAPLISQIMAMAVSRKREYLADASGAELTRNPIGLANALEKLESFKEPTTAIKKGSAHLCIVDPLGKKMNFKEGGISEVFGTHPPLSKRITLLKAMAYQSHS